MKNTLIFLTALIAVSIAPRIAAACPVGQYEMHIPGGGTLCMPQIGGEVGSKAHHEIAEFHHDTSQLDMLRAQFESELVPVRVYSTGAQIPPTGVAAYGIVSSPSRRTAGTRDRWKQLCAAYVANLPKPAELHGQVPRIDQMLTIWPLDNPNSPSAAADDCDFVVDHYELYAGQAAIRDAARQGAHFTGEGPFLIGWSPANTRGAKDKLVLVVDLSWCHSEDAFNHAFKFWREKIIQDPKMWRSGFDPERLRLSIRDFFNQYGDNIVGAIKLYKVPT